MACETHMLQKLMPTNNKQINTIHHINKFKVNHHPITSLDTGKALDKIPTPVHYKSPGEMRDTRDIPQHNKDTLQEAYGQHLFNWRETQSNSTKIWNKTRLSILFKFLARPMRQVKEIRGYKLERKKAKVSFGDDMKLHTSDPKNSTGIFLRLINTLSKVEEYKINSKK